MAKEENLKGHGFHEIAAEKQRQIASEGGKARVKQRRAQKAFRDCLNAILEEDGGTYKGEIVSKKELIAIRALKYLIEKEDLDAREFAKLFEVVRDTIGEKPIDRVQVSELDQSVIDEVEAVIAEAKEEPNYVESTATREIGIPLE